MCYCTKYFKTDINVKFLNRDVHVRGFFFLLLIVALLDNYDKKDEEESVRKEYSVVSRIIFFL